MTTAFTAAAIARPGDYSESLALGHHRILVRAAETGGSLMPFNPAVTCDHHSGGHTH